MRLVFKRIYRINDEIEIIEMEFLSSFCRINPLQCNNLSMRIDFQKSLPQHIHLHLPHSLGGCHQLSVDIGNAHLV